MKNHKHNWISLLLLLLAILSTGCGITPSIPVSTSGGTLNENPGTIATVDGKDGYWYRHAADTYTYPVTTGKTQIPSDLLGRISTAGLVETVVNHPFYASYTHDDPDFAGGVDRIMGNFNGYQELFRRSDAAAELVRFYTSANFDFLHAADPVARFRFSYVEFVIAHNEFIDAMTSEERHAMMGAVIRNVHLRDGYPDYAPVDFVAAALVLGRLLVEDGILFLDGFPNAEQLKIQAFLDTGSMGEDLLKWNPRAFIETVEPMLPGES